MKIQKKFFLSQCCFVLSRAHTGSGVRDILKIEKNVEKNVFTIPTKGFLIHWRVVSIDLDTKQSYIFLQNESKQNFVFFWIFLCVDFDDKENLKDFWPGGGIANLSMSFNVT